MIRLSVTIAKQARDEYWNSLDEYAKRNKIKPLIAASAGSYGILHSLIPSFPIYFECIGAYLANGAEYTGNYDINKSRLVEFHRSRAAILLSEGSITSCICTEVNILMKDLIYLRLKQFLVWKKGKLLLICLRR